MAIAKRNNPAKIQATATAASGVIGKSFIANWNKIIGSAQYILDVATNSGFTTFVPGYQGLVINNIYEGNPAFTVTVPNNSTTYYYRVKGVVSGINTLVSGTITVASAPDAPQGLRIDAIRNEEIDLAWTASIGSVDGYYAYIYLDAGYNQPVGSPVDMSNVTSYTLTGLDPDTVYFIRIAAYKGTALSNYSNTVTGQTETDAPVATAATGMTTTQFSANWNAVTGADSYRLDVATDSGFTSFVTGYNDKTIAAGTLTDSVTGLTAGTTYYYRVRSVNEGGTSANSNTIPTITITTAPIVPPATSILDNGFTANWGAVTGAASYRLFVATNPGLTVFVPGYNNLTVAGTSEAVTGLDPDTTYYIMVRAVNASGTSANSNTEPVTTLP